MGEIRCPRCGVSSPDSAERCDCGYDFRTKTVEKSYLRSSPERPRDVPVAPAGDHDALRVTVVDINMRFSSMVFFMVKWAVAAIPAFIILTALAALVVVLLGGTLAGLVSAFRK